MQRFLIIILVLLFAVPSISVAAEKSFVSIGTGGVTGVYYPAGAAICRLLNRTRNNHGVRCVAESTSGSVSNLKALAAGRLELGIVQSDAQYHAYHGSNQFSAEGPNKRLRSIFSLHSEPFTVVARADSGIKKFKDLHGQRVNIGNPGSGQRATMDVVMAALGWQKKDFSSVSELESTGQSKALCENQFDAMVFTVGHPSSSIEEATSSCDSVLASVVCPEIAELIAANPYYVSATIPGGMYRGTDIDIDTFGVNATVVTSAEVDEDVVYQLVKVVFENFFKFKKQHPAFSSLEKAAMIVDGLSAPLHPGAIRYYKEVGLL